MVEISIIILNYNGIKFAEHCLESVFNTTYSDFEVLFVDNGSADNSLEFVRARYSENLKFTIIENKKNYGFALGNNLGARLARGKYLIFLNIDTIVDNNWLNEISIIMNSDKSIGAAQCKLRLLDSPQLLDSTGHDMDWFGIAFVRGHNQVDKGQYDKLSEIFGATGAALVIRRDIFNRLEGFDPDYFMLFEEDDLCWRTWISGYRVLFIPKAIVFHKSGASRTTKGLYLNLYLSRRNRLISVLKNYEMKNVIRFFPINASLLFAISFVTQCRSDYVRSYLNSILWISRHNRLILQKRRKVQNGRKVSDQSLIIEGIIRKPELRRTLTNGY
jgi:GT2 family glycosyltransferase